MKGRSTHAGSPVRGPGSLRAHSTRRVIWPLAPTLLVLACGGAGDSSPAAVESALTPAPAGPASEPAVLGEIDPSERVSDGGAEPRSPAYWIMWSTCGESSKADVAAANGGRESGWVLLDDLLEMPGVALAGQQVSACEDAVVVLAGAESADVAVRLAAESLAAEINYASGAETCPAFDAALRVGRALVESGADGPQLETAAQETTELLATYNRGTLCQ